MRRRTTTPKLPNRVPISQKPQIRQQLICYFLAMSQGHHAIQTLQQQLVMHPYFNPIALYKKFTKNEQIKKTDYLNYIHNKIGIKSITGIYAYFKKYHLQTKFDCSQFIATLLPYSPDTLRNSYATILWQVNSTPILKKDIIGLFQQLIKIQIYYILNVSYFRKNITLSWNQLKYFIENDLTHHHPKHQQKQFNIMTVRKWMELWIDIHEKDILNIMRWMKGGTQQHIYHNFINIYADDVICPCQWLIPSPIKLKTKAHKKKYQKIHLNPKSKPLSRLQSQMYQRKMSFIQSQLKPPSVMSQRSVHRSNRRNSTSKINIHKRSNSVKLNNISNKNNSRKSVISSYTSPLTCKAKSLLSQYIHVILTGQNNLATQRQILKQSLTKVDQLIHQQIINKKKYITKLSKIVTFIQKNTNLMKISKKFMLECLSCLSIQNQVIISIFTSNIKTNTNQINPQYSHNIPIIDTNTQQTNSQHLNNKQLKKQIAEMLKIYCLTKSKLIKISQQIIKTNITQYIFKILDNKNINYIHKQNFISIMNQMNIEYREGDVQILLRHFGDGNAVTSTSFKRVFQIQGI